jgi:hypothetical protein
MNHSTPPFSLDSLHGPFRHGLHKENNIEDENKTTSFRNGAFTVQTRHACLCFISKKILVK